VHDEAGRSDSVATSYGPVVQCAAAMKTRILKTKLREPINRYLNENRVPKSALAAFIGVSPQKLNAMIEDNWEYITRDALERTADFLNLDLEELFEFTDVKFWNPLEALKKTILLRGVQSEVGRQVQVPRFDDEAIHVVKRFMRRNLQCGEPIIEHALEPAEVIKRVQTENCFVIGSPRTNTATEIIMSEFFGANSGNSLDENRLKIPFGFCWAADTEVARKSVLACSEITRKRIHNQLGITVANGPHVPAHYLPQDDFQEWRTDKGQDAGLVFVANKPFGTKKNTKLIVLAGFAGIGTIAAAKALVEDFRYLEPSPDESYVFGIVQALYRKTAHPHQDDRQLKSYRWRFRSGGHAPMNALKVKSSAR
jgi:hypothetical protein